MGEQCFCIKFCFLLVFLLCFSLVAHYSESSYSLHFSQHLIKHSLWWSDNVFIIILFSITKRSPWAELPWTRATFNLPLHFCSMKSVLIWGSVMHRGLFITVPSKAFRDKLEYSKWNTHKKEQYHYRYLKSSWQQPAFASWSKEGSLLIAAFIQKIKNSFKILLLNIADSYCRSS